MTTVISNPTPPSDNSSGIFIGIFVVIVFGLLFIYFGVPAIRSLGNPQINVPAPVINVPGKIDVNVKQTP